MARMSMKHTVATLMTLPPWMAQAAGERYRLVDADSADAARAEVLIASGGSEIDDARMATFPALKLIAVNGVGYDGIDVQAAGRRGIAVTNTPDVLTDDVADLAIALLLATARRVAANDRFVRAGKWVRGNPPLARKVTGMRVGVLGLGRIGRAIAHRLAGFTPHIAYHSRHPVEGVPYRYHDSPVALADQVDALIVATPGGAATAGLIDAQVLAALGPRGILINVARGSVVDQPALITALEQGRIAGAGLDVFADEPDVPPALLSMDQVVLQPHQASATVETRHAMGELVLANIEAHFAGQPLLTRVT